MNYLSQGLIICFVLLIGCQATPPPTYGEQFEECQVQFGTLDPFDQKDSLGICLKGCQIPHFSISDIHGKMLSSKDLEGKVTVINFWSTTCRPCLAEMPGLNEIVQKYKGHPIRFLGLTADKKSRLEKVFIDKRKFDFEIFSDARTTISDIFRYEWGLPLIIVFDQKGHFHTWFSGSFDDFRASDEVQEKLIPLLDKLLASN